MKLELFVYLYLLYFLANLCNYTESRNQSSSSKSFKRNQKLNSANILILIGNNDTELLNGDEEKIEVADNLNYDNPTNFSSNEISKDQCEDCGKVYDDDPESYGEIIISDADDPFENHVANDKYDAQVDYGYDYYGSAHKGKRKKNKDWHRQINLTKKFCRKQMKQTNSDNENFGTNMKNCFVTEPVTTVNDRLSTVDVNRERTDNDTLLSAVNVSNIVGNAGTLCIKQIVNQLSGIINGVINNSAQLPELKALNREKDSTNLGEQHLCKVPKSIKKRRGAKLKTNAKNLHGKKKWSDWSDWSMCSVSCGRGKSVRWRTCYYPEFCNTARYEMQQVSCLLPDCPPFFFKFFDFS